MELLVALIVVITLVTGVFIGIVVYDLIDRKAAKEEIKRASADSVELVKSIQDAHNSVAQQIVAIQDRLQAQEMRGMKK